MDGLQREVLVHFDQLYQRLDRLEVEYVAITQALRRLEGVLSDERARREALEERARELRAQIAGLEARLSQIEQRLRE